MSTSATDTPINWRERVRLIGKEGFVRAEMIRLGFWPPDEETAQKAAAAESDLRVLYDEIARLRRDLEGVEKEICESQDIPKLLAEIRRRRIERVRAQRAKTREERARERAEKSRKDREWRDTTLPFLGRQVSAGLSYKAGDNERLSAQNLPLLTSSSEIAQAIGISEKDLAWLVYHRGATTIDHYHRFTIPKKRGGTRVISSPKTRLRAAQRWLLENILSGVEIHDAATAFRTGRSILDNAVLHTGKKIVVRIDLQNFFPSIHLPRVKRLFQNLGYNEGVSTVFALLATEAPRVAATLDGEKKFVAVGARCLPQGACTSPAITNILCRRMDARLSGVAQKLGFTYSRYADDLVFSSDAADAPLSDLMGLVKRIVREEKFRVNDQKTRVMRPQHRQAVTGIVVNETPNVSRDDLRRFRAFLHQFEKIGREEMTKRLGQDAQAYASGYLSFVHMVNAQQAQRIEAAHPWLARRKSRD